MTKALLVINMQSICVGKNNAPFFQYDKEKLIANVNTTAISTTPALAKKQRSILNDCKKLEQSLFKL